MEQEMTKKFYIIFIGFLILLLNGCKIFHDVDTEGTRSKARKLSKPPTIGIITNWSDTFSPLIADVIKAPQPAGTRTLLISDVLNNAGKAIPEKQINAVIAEQLATLSQYTIVDKSAVNSAKQALGLSLKDRLVSRSKMIALGRYLGTDLILLSSVEDVQTDATVPPRVAMELLSTKTGEIIWQKSNHQLLGVSQNAIDFVK